MRKEWEGFNSGNWRHVIDVRNFIQKNVTPYTGDDSFLEGPTERTEKVDIRQSRRLPTEQQLHIQIPVQRQTVENTHMQFALIKEA